MSIWDDVTDGIDSPRETFKIEVSGEVDDDLTGFKAEFEALEEELPPQGKLLSKLIITSIEEGGKIIGIRVGQIAHFIDEELENFVTNMRVEKDGEDVILYDKEWAAIHETELEMYLKKGEEDEQD